MDRPTAAVSVRHRTDPAACICYKTIVHNPLPGDFMKPTLRFCNKTKRAGATLLLAVMAVAISGCGSLQDWRDENKGIRLESLKAAPGYQVAVLA